MSQPDSNSYPPDPKPGKPAGVRFGRNPYQVLDHEIAEAIMCQLADEQPSLFGRLLLAHMVPGSVKVPKSRAGG